MEDIININGEQYKKITKGCPDCGAEGLHGCPGKKLNTSDTTNTINLDLDNLPNGTTINDTQGCAWDSIEETFPGSGIKMAGLVCNCPKCAIMC